MVKWIRRILAPPTLQDEYQQLQAAHLAVILGFDSLTILAAFIIGSINGLLQPSLLVSTIVLMNTVLAGFLGLWVRRGKLLQAGLAFLVYKIIFFTIALLELKSINPMWLSGYVFIVVGAGLLLDQRFLLITTCLTSVAASSLLLTGLSPASWVILTLLIGYSALVTYWTQQKLTDTLAHAHQELVEHKRMEEEMASTRNKLEEALTLSLEEMQTFMDVTPGVVFLFREDGQIMHWNRQFQAATGYTEAELKQMNALDLIAQADQPAADQVVAKAISEGRADAELRVRSKNGQLTAYYVVGARMADHSGINYFAGVGVDITNLSQAQEALRESEERFRNLVEAIPDIVLVSDFSGRLLYTTPSLQRHTGLTFEDLQGNEVSNANSQPELFQTTISPDLSDPALRMDPSLLNSDANNMQEAIQKFIQGESPYSEEIENCLVGKDGQPHWYSSILSRVQFQGQPAFQVISRDITEKKTAEVALSRSQERLRALLDATTDVTFLLSRDGAFLALNEATARFYGSSVNELIGRSGFELLPEEMANYRWRKFREVIETARPARFEDYGMNGWSDNNVFPVLSADKKVEALAVFSRDITEQKLAEEALRESEERYALAARGANDGLWDLNLRNGQIYLSPRWNSMLGFPDEEARENIKVWINRVHPEDKERVAEHLDVHAPDTTPHFEIEFRIRHADGAYRWVLTRGAAVYDDHGRAYRAAGSMADITENKRIEAQLLHDAMHDSLTGLPNRALLEDRIEQAIRHQKRYNDYQYAVLYLDLDRFKDINDSHGHDTGDRLLIAVAQRMQTCLRAADTLARLGGDEFVILQTEVKGTNDATSLARRLIDELSRPFTLEGIEVPHTSASIGIVLGEAAHDRAEDIMRDADIAMYRAKNQGRACFQLFDASMRNQVLARVRLESELRQAIERHELEVFYHPILSLGTLQFTGFEALARWRHPVRGLISPAEFIPLAEECQLVIPLDQWVLREACRQVKEWQSLTSGTMHISVNLSGRHFPQADLVENIQQILQETGLDPSDLVVEITESAFMENIEMATASLKGLQKLCVGVEFDDFGTGYSSLNYLRQMPVDTLKIDQSFIQQIATNHREAEIVHTIIRLGHIFGLNVVAEGVETEAQLRGLIDMSCDFAQGYLFSRPLDSKAAADWIRSRWNGFEKQFDRPIGTM